MNRLTGKDELGYYVPREQVLNCLKHRGDLADRLAAYEDTELTPERCAELAEADKEGRLVVLPCRLGDTVFTIYQDCVMECSVEFVNMSKFAGGTVVLCRKGRCADRYGSPFSKFNSSTFTTREEAEKALKEANGDG